MYKVSAGRADDCGHATLRPVSHSYEDCSNDDNHDGGNECEAEGLPHEIMDAIALADSIFHGNNIVTMDDNNPLVQAMAVKDGKIIAIGKKNEIFKLGGTETKYVELQDNQTLMPGLIEPHTHPSLMLIQRCLFTNCSAYYYKSYSEIKQVIDKAIASVPSDSNKWCIFNGWDPELIPDLPNLNWEILDGFSQEIPVVIIGQNYHIAWGNHKAFKMGGIDENSPDPIGGKFERDPDTNKLTGKLLEPVAYNRLIDFVPAISYEDWSKAVDDQWEQYSRCGFTTVAELLFRNNQYDHIDEAIEAKAQQPDCPIRLAIYEYVGDQVKFPLHKEIVNRQEMQAQWESPSRESPLMKKNENHNELQKLELQSKKTKKRVITLENDKLWFAGVKIIADGSPHCGTIATREPFLENDLTKMLGFPPSPNYGLLMHSKENLYKMVKYWHDEGKQIAIHAHGEKSIDQVLDIYEKIMTVDSDRRHRMEHLGLAEESHLIRSSKLNLGLSFFVGHLYFYAQVYSELILGKERTNRFTPLSLASKHGLQWTLHQDNPAYPGPPEPFASMQTAVTRTLRGEPTKVYGKQYCISIKEALKAYTINAAWQLHKDKELGSLTVGKKADLVILSENPLEVDPLKLVDIKVLDTFLDGRSNRIAQSKEKWMDGKLVYSYQ